MNSFYTALSAVVPMFCMLALGYFLRRVGFLEERTLKQMNGLCFKVFLAVNVYYNIYKVDLAEVLRPKLLLWACAAMFIVMAISIVTALPVEREKVRRGRWLNAASTPISSFSAPSSALPCAVRTTLAPSCFWWLSSYPCRTSCR